MTSTKSLECSLGYLRSTDWICFFVSPLHNWEILHLFNIGILSRFSLIDDPSSFWAWTDNFIVPCKVSSSSSSVALPFPSCLLEKTSWAGGSRQNGPAEAPPQKINRLYRSKRDNLQEGRGMPLPGHPNHWHLYPSENQAPLEGRTPWRTKVKCKPFCSLI